MLQLSLDLYVAITFPPCFNFLLLAGGDTVDRRNPAPPGMYETRQTTYQTL